MKLTVVGSGDAFGSGGRFNTCFLLETRGPSVLVDCGASSLVALHRHGIDPARIDGIVLSHLHGDHFGGLPFLLLEAQFLSRRTKPLVIAGPPGTRERVDAALEVFFPDSTRIAWRFAWEAVEIMPGTKSEILGLAVETFGVRHVSGAPSTAVRLSDGEKVFAYSGDTEWSDALLRAAEGADLFVAECYGHARVLSGHTSWVTLREKLPALRATRIMITHMSPAMLIRADEARAAGVLVADDGLILEL